MFAFESAPFKMETKNHGTTKEQYEIRFLQFLIRRIQHVGGSMEYQHITGHLSQLHPDMRNALFTSKSFLVDFLVKHKDTFVLDDGIVSLVNKGDNDVDIHASLPNEIEDGKGVIVKIFPTFGFIKAKDPIKTQIFFRTSCFGYGVEINLTDYGINIGTMVYFNAILQKKDKVTNQYRATEVWKMDKVDEENNVISKPRKNRETGIYDPINLEGEGIIHKVFDSHGFISANGDERNSVFFHKKRVVNYENIVDLTQVFVCGDLVEFSAHRTTKENARARWEATRVWKKSGKKFSAKTQKDASSKSSSKSSTISVASESPSSITAALKTSQSLTLPGFYSSNIVAKEGGRHKSSGSEMIYNQAGKICPRSNGSVIKFGENFTQLADGDSSTYYVSGSLVTEISWMFSEGDDVQFDAVKIKSAPGWKALLVWTGDKPDIVLSPYLGDFNVDTDEEIDEDIDELPGDTESSVSGLPLSLSSHSSLKSVSMKSESSDFKTNRSGKESSRVTDSPVNAEARKTSNKGFKVRNLCNSSPYSSQNNLSSKESKLSDKSRKSDSKKSGSKSELCNPPSHYSSQSSLLSSKESKLSDKSGKPDSKKSSSNSNLCNPPSHYSSQNSLSSRKSKLSDKSKKLDSEKSGSNKPDVTAGNAPLNFRDKSQSAKNSQTISPSKCDDITVIQDVEMEIELRKLNAAYLDNEINIDPMDHEFTESSDESANGDNFQNSEVNLECKDTEVKETASVTLHQNIIGKTTKVYSSFAELYSSDLQKSVSFFWSIFYCKRKSMEDLKLNDLREVLKVGDTVKFNYFEIVDDSGHSWQKIPLAWSGIKPSKFTEMTPEDFILQNSLSVTIKNKSNYIQHKDNVKKFLIPCDDFSSNNTCEQLNVQTQSNVKRFLIPCDEMSPSNTVEHSDSVQPQETVTKFLIPCADFSANSKDAQSVSQTESCSDDEHETFHSPLPFFRSEELDKPSTEFKALANLVNQKLRMNIALFVDTKVDLNSLSAEIVNMVLDQYNNKESSSSLLKSNCTKENISSGVTCSSCGKTIENDSSSQCINTINTEVQTIFTGEVMASNIYTEC